MTEQTKSRVRHILGISVVLMALAPSLSSALPARSFERAELFATCSGRIAAFAARQHALNQDDAPQLRAWADQFDILLDATMPFAVEEGVPWGQPTLWRSQGWSEVAALLSDADYSFDAGLSIRAMEAVEHRINSCKSVLLPS